MKHQPRDIYDTHRSDSARGDFVPPTGRTPPDSWTREMQKNRRSSFFFGLAVFAVAALIAIVVFQQYLLTIRPRQKGKATTTSTGPIKRMALDSGGLELTPEAAIMIDELASIQLIAIPEKGDIPFNGRWIKQAAYYVAVGEKAYKEEELEGALENFQKALRIFPNLQGVHRYLGLIYLQLKDYPSATEAFERASEEDSLSFGVANNLGVSHLALKDYDTAERYFEQALRLKPGYHLAYLNLATLHLRAERKEQAAEYFKEYLLLKPQDIQASQTYASVLMDLRRWDEAITLLERIRLSSPDVAPIYFRLAQALSHTSREDAAVEVLKHGSMLVDPRKALAWLSQREFDLLRENLQFQELIASLGSTED